MSPMRHRATIGINHFHKFYCRYHLSSTHFTSDYHDSKEAKQPMLPSSSILSIFYYYPCFVELSNIGFYFINISAIYDVTHSGLFVTFIEFKRIIAAIFHCHFYLASFRKLFIQIKILN